MKLILDEHRTAMLTNGQKSAAGDTHDPYPVVKLFTPDGAATWLLTELYPADPDIAFGLCDLGLGYPELGTVRISELEAVRGKIGLPIERDQHFTANRPLSAYARDAMRTGSIVA